MIWGHRRDLKMVDHNPFPQWYYQCVGTTDLPKWKKKNSRGTKKSSIKNNKTPKYRAWTINHLRERQEASIEEVKPAVRLGKHSQKHLLWVWQGSKTSTYITRLISTTAPWGRLQQLLPFYKLGKITQLINGRAGIHIQAVLPLKVWHPMTSVKWPSIMFIPKIKVTSIFLIQ